MLVAHDNRILDVADGIIHLDEGRLSSFSRRCARARSGCSQRLATFGRGSDVTKQVAQLAGAARP